MIRLKKLDWLVIKSFIGPFILTFFIAQFVLVMQFLWKYIDDLVGKGLDTFVLMELLFYASAQLVPLALPLAVLLASIMTYGSFGEHLELTAARSAGVSLYRFMRPLTISVVGISIFAFFFSNNILPVTNLKFGALLYDIRHQKPTVALKPGIFYNGIDGFFIKVRDKNDATNTLYDVMVFDHTSGNGDDHVITAQKGSMTQDEEAMALSLLLENGNQYREIAPKEPNNDSYTMVNTTFSSWEKRFDLSQFKLNRTDESFFKDLKKMLNLKQLMAGADTIGMETQKLKDGMASYIAPYNNMKKFGLDTTDKLTPAPVQAQSIEKVVLNYEKPERIQVLEKAMQRARNVKNFTDVTAKQLEYKERDRTSYLIEIYRKFTLSFACLVLFFIGAPLGSIIRKGGLGWPLFYSVIFFIIYHVTSIIGEKLSENNVLTVFAGMWLSAFTLLPIGFFLTLKAANDSKIYSPDYYANLLRKIVKPKNPAW